MAGYPGQFGNVLITKESLDKFVKTLEGRPVIIQHQTVTNENVKDLEVGRVHNVWYNNKDGWYWCDGIITDDKAVNLIDNGWSVSCSYNVLLADDKGGTENNIKYDMEFLDGVFTHLAIVDNPRYERANIVFNSKTVIAPIKIDVTEEIKKDKDILFLDGLKEILANLTNPTPEDMRVINGLSEIFCVENDERWITIKPHGKDAEDYKRLKLRDGETPKEGMKRVYGVDIGKGKDSKNDEEIKKEIENLKRKQNIVGKDTKMYQIYGDKIKELEDKLNGSKPTKEPTKNIDKSNGNGLLPTYAKSFLDKKKAEEKAREKWHILLAEYQEKAKNDKTLLEYGRQIDEVYKEMSQHRYDEEFQKLINKKNEILDKKRTYEKEFFKEVYAAQEEYSNLSTSQDKADIIRQMTPDIKNQIKKISANNDKLVNQLNKIDTAEFDKLQKADAEYDKKQDEITAQLREMSYDDPRRPELRKKFDEYATKRGEIRNKQKEIKFKVAQEVSKILQVENGVKLNTKCSPAMQEITDKLKQCLDGVIPSSNFDNSEMTIRKHNGRAYHSGSTINISQTEKIETAIHETMHHLEEHSEHVLMNSLAFATARTEGEKQQSLKKLTGLGYKQSEVCKKDDFFNPYCGKLYDQFGGKNKTFSNATASEIMSMGVQELFTNPKEFAKNDREYFDFVVANLQGKLWL